MSPRGWNSVLLTCKSIYQTSKNWAKHGVVTLGTSPYYRFFRQNTLLPILHIVKCLQRGDSDGELVKLLTNWRERKLYELHYIQVASTILAGAVIGCFSWIPVVNGYWIGPALWYCTLVLSITAILLSSSQAFIFSALNTPTPGHKSSGDFRRYMALLAVIPGEASPLNLENIRPELLSKCAPRWKMIFIWQAPMMLMAYAVTFFLAGLTVYVCTPLFNGEVSTPGAKTSIFYLTTTGVTGSVFIYCSFYAYRFIDLDQILEVGEILPPETIRRPWAATSIPLNSRKSTQTSFSQLQTPV